MCILIIPFLLHYLRSCIFSPTIHTWDNSFEKAESDLKTLHSAAKLFTMIFRRPPTSMDEFLSPPNRPNGKRIEPILEELPRDPWDNPYRLVVDKGDCTFQCAGEDGVFGTSDDLEEVLDEKAMADLKKKPQVFSQ